MKIINYDRKYKNEYIALNAGWIVKNFGFIEHKDIECFHNIDEYIKTGSMIFMSVDKDTLLSGCMAKKCNDTEWEICRLCSNGRSDHKGTGSAVFKACMDYALQNGAKRIFAVPDERLKAAVHICKKFGFRRAEREKSPYERGGDVFEYIAD